jgi:hypothetical protein
MCHYILHIYLHLVYSQLSVLMKRKDTRIIKKHRQSQFQQWLGNYGHCWIQKFRNVYIQIKLYQKQQIIQKMFLYNFQSKHFCSNKNSVIYAQDTWRNTGLHANLLLILSDQMENWNGSTILHKILQYLISWKSTWPFSSCFVPTDSRKHWSKLTCPPTGCKRS